MCKYCAYLQHSDYVQSKTLNQTKTHTHAHTIIHTCALTQCACTHAHTHARTHMHVVTHSQIQLAHLSFTECLQCTANVAQGIQTDRQRLQQWVNIRVLAEENSQTPQPVAQVIWSISFMPADRASSSSILHIFWDVRLWPISEQITDICTHPLANLWINHRRMHAPFEWHVAPSPINLYPLTQLQT